MNGGLKNLRRKNDSMYGGFGGTIKWIDSYSVFELYK